MTDQTTPNHNEAPASFTIKFFLSGFDSMLTLRGSTYDELQPEIARAVEWLKTSDAVPTIHNRPPSNGNGNGAHQATPPSAPAGNAQPPQRQAQPPAPQGQRPQQPQQPQGPVETIPVISVAHAMTENGHHFIKVKGGKYAKFGVKAWEEVIPVAGWQDWPIGAEYIAPAGMQYATIQDGKKVTAFSAGMDPADNYPEEPPF